MNQLKSEGQPVNLGQIKQTPKEGANSNQKIRSFGF